MLGFNQELLKGDRYWRLVDDDNFALPSVVLLLTLLLQLLYLLLSKSDTVFSYLPAHKIPKRSYKFGIRRGAMRLQLSGTNCRFTFAPRPLVAVSFKQGSRLIFSDWPFTDFSSENYRRDWTELTRIESLLRWMSAVHVPYAPPLVISSSCRRTVWTHVAFWRSLYLVRDCGTFCLDRCMTLATSFRHSLKTFYFSLSEY